MNAKTSKSPARVTHATLMLYVDNGHSMGFDIKGELVVDGATPATMQAIKLGLDVIANEVERQVAKGLIIRAPKAPGEKT